MLSSDQINELVNHYAPIIVLNSNEKYFLTSAEKYISDCNVVSTSEGDGLSLKNRDSQTLAGDMNAAKTYINIKMHPDDDFVDIQYWCLYAFNGAGTLYIKYWVPGSVEIGLPPKVIGPHYESAGDYVVTPCGQHEGDWEHITVRVNLSDSSIQQIYYSQHRGGTWQAYSQPASYPDRVVFYSSKYGHAAYSDMGRNYTETHKYGAVELRLVNDTTSPGATVDMRDRYQIIGIQLNGEDVSHQYDDYVRPDWMNYTGRWGEVLTQRPIDPILTTPLPVLDKIDVKITLKDAMEKMGIYDQCEQESGPQPPWSKDSWQSNGE
jgi:hypothetical protein